MDEVDLILHPMKSELNFPIGMITEIFIVIIARRYYFICRLGAKEELDLSPLRWLLPIHLLDAIFYCDTGRMSVPFKSSKRANSILRRLSHIMEEGYSSRALQKTPHCILLNTDWYHG